MLRRVYAKNLCIKVNTTCLLLPDKALSGHRDPLITRIGTKELAAGFQVPKGVIFSMLTEVPFPFFNNFIFTLLHNFVNFV
jgi:hypothetical protein